MERKLVIAVGVAVGLVMATCIWVKNTRAPSTVKPVTLYDVRYFPGTNFNYVFVALRDRPKYECQRLLDMFGISLPWRRFRPVKLSGPGPVLILYGHIEVEEAEKIGMELRSDNGESLMHQNLNGTINLSQATATAYIWFGRLTNHTYHLRCLGRTNDLAIIRVR